MTLGQLLDAARAVDPIAFYVAAIAMLIVVAAILFRRGGVDARFIILVFAISATIGTIPKIALWAAAHFAKSPNPPELSGIDLVVAGGGLLAIIWSAAQELLALFVGGQTEPSLAAKWWRRRLATVASNKLPKWFPQSEPREETPEAKAARARMEPGNSHEHHSQT
jgi:hypothetical protein